MKAISLAVIALIVLSGIGTAYETTSTNDVGVCVIGVSSPCNGYEYSGGDVGICLIGVPSPCNGYVYNFTEAYQPPYGWNEYYNEPVTTLPLVISR